MNYITNLTPDPRPEIQKILRANDIQTLQLDGDEGNITALNDMRDYLDLAEKTSKRVILSELIEKRYGMPPYGWPELEVVLLVAKLAALREIDLVFDSGPLPLDKAYDYITAVRSQSKVIIKRRANADSALIKKAQQLGKDLFGQTGPATESELFTDLKERLGSWHEQIKEYQTRIDSTGCPGIEDLKAGNDLFRPLVGEGDSLKFLQRFVANDADLRDFKDDYQDVNGFFQNQYSTWQTLKDAITTLAPNQRQLNAHDKAGPALTRLDAISKMPRPYANLHEVAGLQEIATIANNELISEARKPVLESIKRHTDQLDHELLQVKADDALKKSATAELLALKADAETNNSIAHIQQAGNEAELALDKALHAIEKAMAAKASGVGEGQKAGAEPVVPQKPRRLVRAADAWQGGFIESGDDVDMYLQELRTRLQAALDAGERVQLK